MFYNKTYLYAYNSLFGDVNHEGHLAWSRQWRRVEKKALDRLKNDSVAGWENDREEK